MFGTLVSSASAGHGELEFVKNPHHADAINRNIRTKIHVSCAFCRSRKARCSGGKAPCQRCASMGIKCVFPSTHARGASSNNNNNSSTRRERSHRHSIFRAESQNTPPSNYGDDAPGSPGALPMWSPPASDAARSTADASDGAATAALADLSTLTFDQDDSLLMPWTSAMDSPVLSMQQQNPFDLERASSLSVSSSDGLGPMDPHTSMNELSASSRKPSMSPLAGDKLSMLLGIDAPDTWDSDLFIASPQGMVGANEMGNEILGKTSTGGPNTPSGNSSSGGSSSSRGSSPCCLLGAIAFLERLSSRTTTAPVPSGNEIARIDALFAELRSAIETLAGFLGCERCATSMELSMLLTMAVRQINALCKRSTAAYQALVGAYEKGSLSPEKGSPPQQQQQQQQQNQQGLDALVSVSVSTYRTSPRERLHMLRSLLMLQISEFQGLVQTVEAR